MTSRIDQLEQPRSDPKGTKQANPYMPTLFSLYSSNHFRIPILDVWSSFSSRKSPSFLSPSSAIIRYAAGPAKLSTL